MILPLPRTGPSSRWRLQLMTKVRLSSLAGGGVGARGLQLVGLAVAGNAHARRGRVEQAAVLEIAVERAW